MAENYGILNGQRIDIRDNLFCASNRAFRYGDGIFESIRLIDGKPVNIELHYQRLVSGCQVLKMELPEGFDLIKLQGDLIDLAHANEIAKGGRARLQLYREDGATYTPNGTKSGYLLELNAYKRNKFVLNKEGLSVGVFDEIKKAVNPLSNFKTCNALIYVLAGHFAGSKELDDAFLINEHGNIIEATSSNLFIVSNGVLYTPGLDEGCVGGTMRMRVINLALEQNMKVYECPLNMQNILSADEMFLTNAVSGIRWIGSFKTKRYYNKVANILVENLNKSLVSSKMDLLDN